MYARILLASWLMAAASLLAAHQRAQGQTLFMDNVFTDDMGYPNATAEMTYVLEHGSTTVHIDVQNAPPNEYWSIWTKLVGGEAGVSPLTGIDVIPLAAVSDIAAMATSTPDSALTETAKALGLSGDDGSGSTAGPNGFFTDASGNASHSIVLDYPLVEGGAFPFDQFDASLTPVHFGSTPFLHNTLIHFDGVGYGLHPGAMTSAAPWFWTSQYAVPEPSSVLLLGAICLGAVVRWRWNLLPTTR